MKKNLIAMAILAATCSVAMAQSSVSVYGVMDLGFQSRDNGVNRVNGIESGMVNGSRLGFKGSEDLGNGLKAGFILETEFMADTGGSSQTSGNWGEQTLVYLSSDAWGKLSLGNQYSPIRNSLYAIDPFNIGYAGDARNVFNATTRVKNSVAYSTNTYSGFNASAIYGAGEVAGSNSDGRTLGFNVNYNQGPIGATLAYNTLNSVGFVSDKQKDLLVGGTYDFGVVKAHLGYGDHKEGSFKKRNYLVGASVPVSNAGKVMVSYILNDVRSFDNADSTQVAVGYTHDLSKRTQVYTAYSHTSNDDNAAMHVARTGANGSTFQLGLRHAF